MTANAATNPNKALWEKGDFTRIAESIRETEAEFIGTLGITPKLKVLDLGCGDGTASIPAAKIGADVLGVDIASNLVAAGNRRAKEHGLTNVRFQEGDASNLAGLSDHSFDLVVSVFGAMFAPNPAAVAKEMVRVTRKGGRIIMGNWIPGDPTLIAQILKISAAYTPPPPAGFISPVTWGVESEVTARFEAAGIAKDAIKFDRVTCDFRFPEPPAHFLEEFRRYYGPTMNAFDAATKAGKVDQLAAELKALFERENRSPDKSKTHIPATFLKVSVNV